MKWLASRRGLFVLGFVILVVTNIVVLAGVAANRSGEPEALVTLTERELPMQYRYRRENSGLSLRLTWRVPSREKDEYSGYHAPAWLDTDKLAALGFNLDLDPNAAVYKPPIPKTVFIALEFDGETYHSVVARAELALVTATDALSRHPDDASLADKVKQAKELLARERISESRLFAVDASLDPEVLRAKYPDRNRFIVVQGQVMPNNYFRRQSKTASGYISHLSVEQIFVPLKQRRVLDAILGGRSVWNLRFEPPRYEVTLAYGSRLEPWIVSMRGLVAP